MYPIPWVLLNTRQDGSGRCYWLPFDHFEMDLKVPWLSYHQIRSVSFCMIYSQIANPQISTKYCTTKSPNSAKSRLCKLFFMYKLELQCRVLYALLVRRNSMYLRKFKVRKPQKDRVRKSAECHICGKPVVCLLIKAHCTCLLVSEGLPVSFWIKNQYFLMRYIIFPFSTEFRQFTVFQRKKGSLMSEPGR